MNRSEVKILKVKYLGNTTLSIIPEVVHVNSKLNNVIISHLCQQVWKNVLHAVRIFQLPPCITDRDSRSSTCLRNCVRKVRVALPLNGSITLDPNVLVGESRSSGQGHRHVPEVIACSVGRSTESDRTAGIPRTELGNRAGKLDVLPIDGGSDDIKCYRHSSRRHARGGRGCCLG